MQTFDSVFLKLSPYPKEEGFRGYFPVVFLNKEWFLRLTGVSGPFKHEALPLSWTFSILLNSSEMGSRAFQKAFALSRWPRFLAVSGELAMSAQY